MDCGSGSREHYTVTQLVPGCVTTGETGFDRSHGGDGRQPAIKLDSRERYFMICEEQPYGTWCGPVCRSESQCQSRDTKPDRFSTGTISFRQMIFGQQSNG